MNEIEVITSIRKTPDKPELVVTLRKLAAQGGEIRIVGEPVETRLDMATRQVQISIFAKASYDEGFHLGARVLNSGLIPIHISRVAFSYKFEEIRDVKTSSGIPMQEVGGGLNFTSFVGEIDAWLQPGESKDYFLPPGSYEEATKLGMALKPSQYQVIAYSGPDEVGRLEGRQIGPFLDQGRIKTTRRAVEVLHSLSEQERLLIMEEAYSVVGIPPTKWPQEKVIALEGEPTTFLLSVKPDLRVFIKPIEWEERLEIIDVVREDALEPFIQSEVEQGEKG